jgi:hypothetical protein
VHHVEQGFDFCCGNGFLLGLMNMMPKVKRHVRFNLNQSEVDEKGTQLNGHILAPHQ